MPNREFPFNQPIHPEDNRSINKAFDRNYGNRIKSGDTTPLKYTIKDGDGEPLDKERLLAMDVTAILKYEDIVAYETEAIVTLEDETENYAGDLVVRFTIQEALAPSATPYILEFHFENGESSDRFIFPSANNLDIYITPSALNSDDKAIEKSSEQRLKEIVESSQTLTDVKTQEEERIANEEARQAKYIELVDTGIMQENINQKLSESEQTYAPRLTNLEQNDADLTAQLAQNERTPYVSKQVQNTSNKPKPIVVFTLDDGAVEDINLMKPLFDEFGYKFTTYIVPNFVGTTQNGVDYMNKTQLKELYDDGHEIGAHTMNHLSMGHEPPEVVDYEMRESKRVLTEWGFEPNNFAYPFGARSDTSDKIALKYFRTSTLFLSAIKPNTIPIKKSGLERKSLGSYPETPTTAFPVTDTFQDYYKYWVDDAINNNRLTVFALHPWKMPSDTVQLGYLRDTLQYCKDNNVPVMTLNEALYYFDNQLDFKVYNPDNTVKSEIMFDANGELSSGNMIFNKKIQGAEARQLNQDSLPEDYPMGYTRLEISDGNLWSLYGGSVVVYTDKANTWPDGVRQWVHQKHGTAIKYRSAKADGTWTEFVDIVSTSSQQIKFTLTDFKPITSGFDLAPHTSVTYDIPNSVTDWKSVVVANSLRKLPDGVIYQVRNNNGLGCKLQIINTNTTIQWIPNTTQFIIKEV